ncbi:hypothetical protein HHL22_14900 [Hymenobacter sp. RP-2-7]|uniref:Lipoprotein n=1 Tax=Hymenobacter polaris TaxID=2682546 RepID=A0A7Y0FNH3_9BACT|nr:hypothetical protein [Hymenobacter polaris]NML66495.1 hypothetical protein [Hymenobacter polaris]
MSIQRSRSILGLPLGLALLVACTRPAVVGAAGPEAPGCCQSRYPVAALGPYSTAQLGQEYRRLKRAKCAACSRYGSDLQKVLNELGTRLNGQPRQAVWRAMGKPDEANDSLLIYHWRYRHDYLRFRLAPNGTVASSWYYAWE